MQHIAKCYATSSQEQLWLCDNGSWAPPKTSGICGCDLIHSPHEEAIMKQAGLFGLSDHLKRLSANGDPL
ncbi:MAG: hypothetical protein ACK519_07570, partial [Sphingomonadaceae bacterium]